MDYVWVLMGLAGAGCGLVAGAITGFLGGLVADYRTQMRLDSLEARVIRLNNAAIAQGGSDAASAKAERQAEAMAFVMSEMNKEGADPKAVIQIALGKYPDVAASLTKRMLKQSGVRL